MQRVGERGGKLAEGVWFMVKMKKQAEVCAPELGLGVAVVENWKL